MSPSSGEPPLSAKPAFSTPGRGSCAGLRWGNFDGRELSRVASLVSAHLARSFVSLFGNDDCRRYRCNKAGLGRSSASLPTADDNSVRGRHAPEKGPEAFGKIPGSATSTADLKSLHCKQRIRSRDFRSSGTQNVDLLVPFAFRSSCKRLPRCLTNFGKRALEHVSGNHCLSMVTPPSPEATVGVPPNANIRSRIPVNSEAEFFARFSSRDQLSRTRTRA